MCYLFEICIDPFFWHFDLKSKYWTGLICLILIIIKDLTRELKEIFIRII